MMKVRNILFIVVVLVCSNSASSQFYTSAGIAGVEAARSANEGDMYLDTTNNDYRIGLTHGLLGRLTDNQSLDSGKLENDSIYLFIQNGQSASVDVSSLKASGTKVGDIKAGLQVADHNGWYLMDGRGLGTLPAVAQANAAGLGIAGSLPDATDRVMKTKTGAEALLSTGGSGTYSITQANIPNYTLSGSVTTGASGAHTHTVTVDSAGLHGHNAEGNNFGVDYKGFSNSGSDKDTSLIIGSSNQFKTDSAGLHTHTYSISSDGAHTHTVSLSSGGSGTPISLYQPFMVVNRFIYLGQ